MDGAAKPEAHAAVAAEETPLRALAEFLESCPPDAVYEIGDLAIPQRMRASATGALTSYARLLLPEIKLHCDGQTCDGPRQFKCEESTTLSEGRNFVFLNYVCKNCDKTIKTFALAVRWRAKLGTRGEALKLGEMPTFGPPTPARVINSRRE